MIFRIIVMDILSIKKKKLEKISNNLYFIKEKHVGTFFG